MRIELVVAVAVAAVGCSTPEGLVGPAGAPGPQGPQGPIGPVGPAGADGVARGLAYVDARGTLVGVGSTYYADDAGVLWPVDLETAEIVSPDWWALYESNDCTGRVLSAPWPAGTAARVAGESTWHVRGRTTKAISATVRSTRNGAGACFVETAPSMRRVLVISDLEPRMPPALTLEGPLHAEVR